MDSKTIDSKRMSVKERIEGIEWMNPGIYDHVICISYNMLFSSVLQELNHPTSADIRRVMAERSRAIRYCDMKPDSLAIIQAKKMELTNMVINATADPDWQDRVINRSYEILDSHEALLRPHATIIGRSVDEIFFTPAADSTPLMKSNYFCDNIPPQYRVTIDDFTHFIAENPNQFAALRTNNGSKQKIVRGHPNEKHRLGQALVNELTKVCA